MSSKKKKSHAPEMELVLGAGGVKGYGHVGVLKSIEKNRIAIGEVTGVSIGSLIAAFYSNGFTAAQIHEILAREAFLTEGAATLQMWQDALTLKGLQSAGLVNLAPIMQRIVKKYKLVPNSRLKIVAYNISSLSPVLFSGENYNLAKAIAGSCSVPLVMRPVIERLKGSAQKQTLVDGCVYHTHPSDFCKGPAIVSKLGFASRLPSEWLPPAQLFMHFAELANCLLLDWYFEDPRSDRNHILIQSGLPDVASMSFNSSSKKCLEMVAHGERQADLKLRTADVRRTA
jgi:predicted acylesterase/phospholipase RssA